MSKSPDDLGDDLKAITDALSDAMIDRQMSLDSVLAGIQAFLMALVASNRAQPTMIAERLFHMSDYFDSLSEPVDTAASQPEWNN